MARAETDAWLETLGWNLAGANPARDDLASALLALRQLGWRVGPEVFDRYARHADALADAELAYVAEQTEPAAAVEATVIGTVVFERALIRAAAPRPGAPLADAVRREVTGRYWTELPAPHRRSSASRSSGMTVASFSKRPHASRGTSHITSNSLPSGSRP